MGSKSDYEVVYEAAKILNEFGAAYEMIVSSAHRSPARTAKYVADAEKKGAQVFICAAGMAAPLAGAVAANTTKPVLGVPLGGRGRRGAVFVRADACWNPRRDACDRQGGRKKRGVSGGANFSSKRRASKLEAKGGSRGKS